MKADQVAMHLKGRISIALKVAGAALLNAPAFAQKLGDAQRGYRRSRVHLGNSAIAGRQSSTRSLKARSRQLITTLYSALGVILSWRDDTI